MCPPLIAAIIPAVAGIASTAIGAAAAGGRQQPQQPTAPAGGVDPSQLAQLAQLAGGAFGGAMPGAAGAAGGGLTDAQKLALAAQMPAALRTADGKRAPDEVPYRAPHATTLDTISTELSQRPLQRTQEQAGRAIVRRVSEGVDPQLAAIRRQLNERATQIQATAEHREIVSRDAFRRRVVRDLTALRRGMTRGGWARF